MTKIEELISLFNSLPSIGKKSAQKIAIYFISQDNKFKEEFIQSLKNAKNLELCKKCFGISQNIICDICLDKSRDAKLIVVSSQQDLLHIESLKLFNSYYFVLGGEIESADKNLLDKLKFNELKNRIKDGLNEVIIFTNPTLSGELTANYIYKILEDTNVKITKLANGLPIGASLDYMDGLTISEAYKNRKEVK